MISKARGFLEASRPSRHPDEAPTSAHARQPEGSDVSMGSGATYLVVDDASGRGPHGSRRQVREVIDAQPPPPYQPRGHAGVSTGTAGREGDADAPATEHRPPNDA